MCLRYVCVCLLILHRSICTRPHRRLGELSSPRSRAPLWPPWPPANRCDTHTYTSVVCALCVVRRGGRTTHQHTHTFYTQRTLQDSCSAHSQTLLLTHTFIHATPHNTHNHRVYAGCVSCVVCVCVCRSDLRRFSSLAAIMTGASSATWLTCSTWTPTPGA